MKHMIKDIFNKDNDEFLTHFRSSIDKLKNFSEVINIQSSKEYTVPLIWHLII